MADSKTTPSQEAGQAPVKFERDTKANIHQRLWLAAGEVGQLEKDGKVAGGRNADNGGSRTMYEYISHDLVTLHAKKAFQKHGIMVLPTVLTHEKDGNRTELIISVAFINIDDPEDKVTVSSVGYGVDTSDKGPGKAWSYALKYAYLKVLMLNSADDIEQDDIKHEPAGPTWKAAEQVRKQNTQTLKAWADTFKAALKNARTVDEIKELERANKETLMADETPSVTREHFIEYIQSRKAELA